MVAPPARSHARGGEETRGAFRRPSLEHSVDGSVTRSFRFGYGSSYVTFTLQNATPVFVPGFACSE